MMWRGMTAAASVLGLGGLVAAAGASSIEVSIPSLIGSAITIGTVVWRLAVDRGKIVAKLDAMDLRMRHVERQNRRLSRRLNQAGLADLDEGDEDIDEGEDD